MNRFRRLGFIEYNGRIHVHKSLLNILQDDQLRGQAGDDFPKKEIELRRKLF
jgi:CRP/FNR family cyclic AMP-dependent transcriptional regulator